jgi:hypothetical protein
VVRLSQKCAVAVLFAWHNRLMFGRWRATEELLLGMRGVLTEISQTLHRMEFSMDREFKLTRASVENNTQVTREIVLELREQRPILEHIDHGVQSNTDGLMHVLDELRTGRGGPGTAPAA